VVLVLALRRFVGDGENVAAEGDGRADVLPAAADVPTAFTAAAAPTAAAAAANATAAGEPFLFGEGEL